MFLRYKRNFVSQTFLGRLSQEPPKMEPQKINFLMALARVPVFFDNSKYLGDKYFNLIGSRPMSKYGTPKLCQNICLLWHPRLRDSKIVFLGAH